MILIKNKTRSRLCFDRPLKIPRYTQTPRQISFINGGIGGGDYVKYGYSHIPYIYRTPISSTTDLYDAYVITTNLNLNTPELKDRLTLWFSEKMSQWGILAALTAYYGTQERSSSTITQITNRKTPIVTPLATCLYKGINASRYSELLRVEFLPRLSANIQALLRPLSLDDYTLANYLTQVRQAMQKSDNMVDFLLHLKLAENVLRGLFPNLGDYTERNQSPHLLFAPKCNDLVLQKKLSELRCSATYAAELYIDEKHLNNDQTQPDFACIKAEVLKKCDAVEAMYKGNNVPKVVCRP